MGTARAALQRCHQWHTLGTIGAACALLACSDGTDPTPEPEPEPVPNGRIVWASAHEHGWLSQIYSVEGDGTGMLRLTSEFDLYQVIPNFGAPRIAFVVTHLVDTGFVYTLHTMNADGSGATGPFTVDFPAFDVFGSGDVSADGSLIVGGSGERRLTVGNLMTGEVSHVSTDSMVAGSPFWSPDGDRIGFVAQPLPDGPTDLYTIGTDGSGLTRLTNDAFYEGYAVWSPTGDRIAFVRSQGSGSRMSVIDADGSNLRDVYSKACELPVAWSPDGSQLMCTVTNGPTEALIDVETGEIHLTGFDFVCHGWSPDGTRLVCADSDSIYTLEPDGTGVVTVGPAGGFGFLTWVRGSDELGSVPDRSVRRWSAGSDMADRGGRRLAIVRPATGDRETISRSRRGLAPAVHRANASSSSAPSPSLQRSQSRYTTPSSISPSN